MIQKVLHLHESINFPYPRSQFSLKFIEEANVFFVKKTGGAQIMEG